MCKTPCHSPCARRFKRAGATVFRREERGVDLLRNPLQLLPASISSCYRWFFHTTQYMELDLNCSYQNVGLYHVTLSEVSQPSWRITWAMACNFTAAAHLILPYKFRTPIRLLSFRLHSSIGWFGLAYGNLTGGVYNEVSHALKAGHFP